jgi:hypothetical protein
VAKTASPPTPTVSVQARTFQRLRVMAIQLRGTETLTRIRGNSTSKAPCLRQLAGPGEPA